MLNRFARYGLLIRDRLLREGILAGSDGRVTGPNTRRANLTNKLDVSFFSGEKGVRRNWKSLERLWAEGWDPNLADCKIQGWWNSQMFSQSHQHRSICGGLPCRSVHDLCHQSAGGRERERKSYRTLPKYPLYCITRPKFVAEEFSFAANDSSGGASSSF